MPSTGSGAPEGRVAFTKGSSCRNSDKRPFPLATPRNYLAVLLAASVLRLLLVAGPVRETVADRLNSNVSRIFLVSRRSSLLVFLPYSHGRMLPFPRVSRLLLLPSAPLSDQRSR